MNVGLKVGSDHFVLAADIARALGLSRQRVAQLIKEPGFPRPVGRLAKSDVYRWEDVQGWLVATGRRREAPVQRLQITPPVDLDPVGFTKWLHGELGKLRAAQSGAAL